MKRRQFFKAIGLGILAVPVIKHLPKEEPVSPGIRYRNTGGHYQKDELPWVIPEDVRKHPMTSEEAFPVNYSDGMSEEAFQKLMDRYGKQMSSAELLNSLL